MSLSMTSGQFKMPRRFHSSLDAIKRGTVQGLRQGISPRRLALTLALGFAIGCIPVVGIPTLVCAALALALRLNLPAIQAANYAVMPLQLLLIVPFVRLGGWLFATSRNPSLQAGTLLHASPHVVATQMGWLAGQALLAWVLIALPAVLLLTFMLTKVLRRIPALAAAEAGD
ncbi:MAG: DUF2062 domain-containing protein [Terracidiphilus sp.]|jgi:uncharacterized protein (DUF2062 family)